jgi:hypothetical protein
VAEETLYMTEAVRALIGVESAEQWAPDPVEHGSIRRMVHAIMDRDPVYSDNALAAQTRYRGLVAPPLFPVHMFQRGAADPDPLERAWEDPGYDGSKSPTAMFGLPALPIPLKRLLNAGVEVEFLQQARPGERISVINRYADIFEKKGRNGPMVFAVVERRFFNQDREPLLIYRQTLVYS